jgi:mRNA interferase MazF
VVKRCELWWVEDPDLGRRPHLVMTREAAIGLLTKVLAVPATRTIRGGPAEVRLGPDDGLPTECVLTLDNIAPVPKSYFVERIGLLRGNRMHEVCKALAIATGCD